MASKDITARRILVVDDNANMRLLIRRGLRDAFKSAEFLECTDGSEAVYMLRGMPEDKLPDVVVTDLEMQPLSGLEFLREIRGNNDYGARVRMIPIILVSDQTDVTIIDKILGAGANAFVSRPVSMSTLAERIRQILASPPTFVGIVNAHGPGQHFFGPASKWVLQHVHRAKADGRKVLTIPSRPRAAVAAPQDEAAAA